MRISDFILLDTSNIIIATTSDAFQIEHLLGFSVAVVFTGSSNLTGSFILQASNDNTNWIDITDSSVSGTSGSCMFNITEAFYKSVRLKVIPTTGTISTITAKVYTKGW